MATVRTDVDKEQMCFKNASKSSEGSSMLTVKEAPLIPTVNVEKSPDLDFENIHSHDISYVEDTSLTMPNSELYTSTDKQPQKSSDDKKICFSNNVSDENNFENNTGGSVCRSAKARGEPFDKMAKLRSETTETACCSGETEQKTNKLKISRPSETEGDINSPTDCAHNLNVTSMNQQQSGNSTNAGNEPHARTDDRREQIFATIYGQCIGDAIGLLTEFLTMEQANYYYKDYSTLEYSQKVRDEHRKRWAVGDWTDDSDQMLLIMLSLVENDGEVNHIDFAERLVNWMEYGFAELGDKGGSGIGLTTFQTLRDPEFLSNPYKVSERVWKRSGRAAAPNGGVMRTSILGIHDWWDLENVVENARSICRTTHHDPRCVVSAICVCFAISSMLQKNPEDIKDGEYNIAKIIGDVYTCAKLHLPEECWEELRKYLYCTNLEELKLDESHAIGYTYKCLGAGFWALKQDNFREALEAIVRSGGDADTNGAVAGALLGCKLGSRDHIPETWLSLKHRAWLDKQIERYLQVLKARYPANDEKRKSKILIKENLLLHLCKKS